MKSDNPPSARRGETLVFRFCPILLTRLLYSPSGCLWWLYVWTRPGVDPKGEKSKSI